MKTQMTDIKAVQKFCMAIVLSLFCFDVYANKKIEKAEETKAAIAQLDEMYQSTLNDFYNKLLKKQKIGKQNIDELANLPNLSQEIGQSGQLPMAAAKNLHRLRANTATVYENLYGKSLKNILEFLYQVNDTATIQKLTDKINSQATPTEKSLNYFLQAKYYHEREHWFGVNAALRHVNAKELPSADAHYSDLLRGYALQEQKKHREAVIYYKSIPENSPYFKYAKLNEGLAYMRQGWWSEAHYEFQKAINALDADEHREFVNRMRVVLGFSQIHHEFFRDARKSLRKVTLDSSHTQKALIGIGLAAAYQEDYVGAVNAFKRVTQSNVSDINVDEAYLLVPAVYQEQDENALALEAYEAAKLYYQKRLADLRQAKDNLNKDNSTSIPQLLKTTASRGDEIYGEKDLIPHYIIDNYFLILAFDQYASELGFKYDFSALEKKYENSLKALVISNIELREELLKNYLSQARYGVAQLYDNP